MGAMERDSSDRADASVGRLEMFNSTHGIHYTQKGPKTFKDCCSIVLRLNKERMVDNVKLLDEVLGWELYVGPVLVPRDQTSKYIDMDTKSLKLTKGLTTVRYRLKQLSTMYSDARYSLRFFLEKCPSVTPVKTPGTYVMSKHGRLTRQDYAPFFGLKDEIGKNCDGICRALSSLDLSNDYNLHISEIPAAQKYIYSSSRLVVLRRPVKEMPLPAPGAIEVHKINPMATRMMSTAAAPAPATKQQHQPVTPVRGNPPAQVYPVPLRSLDVNNKRQPKPSSRYPHDKYFPVGPSMHKRRRSNVSTTDSVYSDTDVDTGFVDESDLEAPPPPARKLQRKLSLPPPSEDFLPKSSYLQPMEFNETSLSPWDPADESYSDKDLIWQLFDFDFSSNPDKQKELYDIVGGDIFSQQSSLRDVPDHLL